MSTTPKHPITHDGTALIRCTDLLGCPFCGGKPEIERHGTARQSMIIACTNCGCRMESGDVLGLTPVEAWAWNYRHPNVPAQQPPANDV
jgi:hypothetical protein